MARIRTVKPDFFKHEELYQLEINEKLPLRVAFVGLWCVCDREGRFKWRPNQLKLDILPYDKIDFSRVLDALATHGFIVEYVAEDENNYGFVPTFLQHQVINNRESESVLPSPFDASSTRDPRALSKNKGKGKEGKGRERKGKELSEQAIIDFNLFWDLYPKKVGKDKALESWLNKKPRIDDVIFTLRWQSESDNWKENNGQFIPNPATYLNQGRWQDEQPVIDMNPF
jgi:hypothetical protein